MLQPGVIGMVIGTCMAMPLLHEVHYREDIVLYRPEVLATSPMAGINSLLTGKKL